MNRLVVILLVSALLTEWTPHANALEPALAESSRDRFAGWIDDLTAKDFQTRKSATENLTEAGADAADAVAEAADSDDKELPLRCVNILKSMLHHGDPTTKAAAKTALKRLTKSDRAFLAKLAQKTLDTPPPAAGVVGPQFGGRVQINGAMIPNGRNVRINIKTVNGQRSISVQVDEKQIEITDNNGRDITVTVTEPIEDENGNTVRKPKTYTAENFEELQKNHPEAAKLYQQYAGFGRPAPMQRLRPFRVRVDLLKKHHERLLQMQQELEDRFEDGKLPEASLNRMRESIVRHREHLLKQIEAAEEAERKANAE